jgi:hypothetical protein
MTAPPGQTRSSIASGIPAVPATSRLRMTEQAPLRLQLPVETTFPHATYTAANEDLCAPAAPLDLQDLVDAPCRSLEAEFKGWRNLDNPEDQAELARDIAAIANAGGGHIAFGFNEETLAPVDTEPLGTNCAESRVESITSTYLDPPPRCGVHLVRSARGDWHPVIRIAGHGATPVVARRDGPVVGGARLIERGLVYIRRHRAARDGPFGAPWVETARIDSPQDWVGLIRRCVRQDSEALLGMIESALEGRRAVPALQDRLLDWHLAARHAFLQLVPRSPVAALLERRHYALSYALELSRPQTVDHAQLPEHLRHCAFEAQALFRPGLRMFEPPYRLAARPRFVADPASGDDDTDFLETAWLRAYPTTETADLWRVSPKGFATIVKPYAEDQAQVNVTLGTQPGTWLNPDLLARELAELVCHARSFARFFAGARRAIFRCDWWGLAGRELFDPEGRWAQSGAALGDHRAAALDVPIASLVQAWPEAVARIMAPVLRALEPDLVLDADWVRAQAPRWRRG